MFEVFQDPFLQGFVTGVLFTAYVFISHRRKD